MRRGSFFHEMSISSTDCEEACWASAVGIGASGRLADIDCDFASAGSERNRMRAKNLRIEECSILEVSWRIAPLSCRSHRTEQHLNVRLTEKVLKTRKSEKAAGCDDGSAKLVGNRWTHTVIHPIRYIVYGIGGLRSGS